MTNEMWIAIIGAIAAIIGAIISTISIVITNKNSRSIKILENSKEVKSDIAKKRYEIYQELIDYINYWRNVKPKLNHDYIGCSARKYLKIFILQQNFFNNVKEIEDEYSKIFNMTKNSMYFDKNTYKILCALNNYLSSVINCYYCQHIDNYNFFYYIVYCDVIINYLSPLSKLVMKFLRNDNVLKYNTFKIIKKDTIYKIYKKTEFYNIYDINLQLSNLQKLKDEQLVPILKKCDDEINQYKTYIKTNVTNISKRFCKSKIKELKKLKKTLKHQIKKCKRFNKLRISNSYQMYSICKDCKNNNCLLNINYNKS